MAKGEEKKFAKLFELSSGDQVLFLKKYDDLEEGSEWLVVVELIYQGVEVRFKMGYESEERRDAYFNVVNIESAELFYSQVHDVSINND